MPCLHSLSASLYQINPPSHLMGLHVHYQLKLPKVTTFLVFPGLRIECDWEVDVYTVCQQSGELHYQVNSPSLTAPRLC